jgi:hypothetical protein
MNDQARLEGFVLHRLVHRSSHHTRRKSIICSKLLTLSLLESEAGLAEKSWQCAQTKRATSQRAHDRHGQERIQILRRGQRPCAGENRFNLG